MGSGHFVFGVPNGLERPPWRAQFSQAYVIAHEVGHHIQNVTGISSKVENARRRASEREGNAMSVRLERQADCFAGVWGFHADKARQL